MTGCPSALLLVGIVVLAGASAGPAGAQSSVSLSSDTATVASRLDIDSGLVQSLNFDEDPTSKVLTTVVEVESGNVFTIELTKHSNRGDQYAVLVDDGSGILREVPAPPVRTYRGVVIGLPQYQVRASYADGKMNALILGPTDSWGVQPTSDAIASAPWTEHVSYSTEAAHLRGTCGNRDEGSAGIASVGPPGGGALIIADLALDADFEYYELCGSSVTDTVDDMEDLINSMEAIYEVQTDIIYEISRVIVRTTGGLYTSTSAGGRLNQFGAVWTSPPESTIGRDVAHLFTGQTLGGGILGIAAFGGVCSFGSGYGLSVGKSPSSYTARVALPAHEIGHNWAASHCDGQPDCMIMCSTLGGCGPLDAFGVSSVDSIVAFRNTRSCLTPEPPAQSLPFFEEWNTLGIEESRWTFQSGAGITSLAQAEPSYPYSLVLNSLAGDLGSDDIRSARILLAGATDATLQFYERSDQVPAGGALIVEYRNVDTEWVELDTVTSLGVEPDQFTARAYSLPADALHDSFRLRFRTDLSQPGERWFVDNISVTDGPPPPLDPPMVTSVAPNTGPLSGGTPVAIQGEGFLPNTTITIGTATLQDLVYVDHFTVTGTTPPGSSGAADITVEQGGVSATLSDAFIYSNNSLSLSTEQASPGGSVTVTAFATNDVSLAGFSLACSFDGAFVDVSGIDVGGTLADGAEFVAPNSSNSTGDSWWTLGVVLDLSPPLDMLLTPGANQPIALIDFDIEASATIGDTVDLELISGVGTPPVDLIFTIDGGTSSTPTTADGAIQISDIGFVRGDANGDGGIDIADPVANLSYQFQSGPATCLDALDTNDDGLINIADPVYNLSFLFTTGPEPPQPYPTAGVDPTPDVLGCDG